MTLFRRLTDLIFRLVEPLAVALFGLLFLLVLAQVVLRYVFNSPLVWSEELAQYLFIWICFIGWLMASRRGSHIAIRTLQERLSTGARTVLTVAIECASMVLSVVLLVQGIAIAGRNLNVTTSSLFFPFAVVYAIVPLAAVVAILISLGNIAAHFSSGPLSGKTGGTVE